MKKKLMRMIAGILLVRKVVPQQECFDLEVCPFGVRLRVVLLKGFDMEVKIQRLELSCLSLCHYAALSLFV